MSTKNIVPRADNEGQLGTAAKKWAKVITAALTIGATDLQTRLSAKLAITGTNLITNGGFETNTTGWSGSASTLSRETGSPLVGTGSLKILLTENGGYGTTIVTTVVGHQYLVTGLVKSLAAAGRLSRLKIVSPVINSDTLDCSTGAMAITLTFTATAATTTILASFIDGLAGESLLVDLVACYDLTVWLASIGALPLAGGTMTEALTTTQLKLSALNTAPANAGATGTLGEIRITADAIYVCIATNTWVKAAIATWS